MACIIIFIIYAIDIVSMAIYYEYSKKKKLYVHLTENLTTCGPIRIEWKLLDIIKSIHNRIFGHYLCYDKSLWANV